jgi:hypothetical protein
MRRNTAWIAIAALVLAAGATTTKRDIRIDYDRSADLGSYRTYGFPETVGTDRAGYSTLVTGYFKDAINREMQKRGYVYDEEDPDNPSAKTARSPNGSGSSPSPERNTRP